MVSRQKCYPREDLTVSQIVAIHDEILADSGGDCRVLSEANLHQLVFRANLIPECVPRAAFVFYSLCAYPAFREGISGTALAVTEQVLSTGGYRIPEKKAGLMALAEGILAFTTEPEEIEQWLRDNELESLSR
jgi:prophage maintenance system killer protein